MQSPMAKTLGRLVRIWSSTMISPRVPTRGRAPPRRRRWWRPAAHGHEHVVRLDALGRAVLLDVDEHGVALAAGAGDLRAGAQLEALLAEDLVGFLDDVVVHAGEDGGQ